MKGMKMVVVLLIAAAVALPLMAGEGHKCTASTQDCLDHMVAQLANRGWVGIEMDDGTMAITKVVDGSPAQTAGLAVGDVLVAANGVKYADGNEKALAKIKQGMTPGSSLTFTVNRDGAAQDITVTLAKLPDAVRAQWIGAHMMEHANTKIAEK